ncbi:MAG: hypothetical protein ACYDD5_10380 [Sulfuricurvum sp.]
MHDEAHIPIIRLIPGTGKNKNPIYVMSDLKTPLATFWLPLFKIEFGNDGSIYTAAAIDATEILRGEGTAKDDGQIHFKYSEEVKLPIDLAKKHEYLSFHSSGKINHPGREKSQMPEMTFKLNNCLDGTHTLCHHLISVPGSYRPSHVPREGIDLYFPNIFDSYVQPLSIQSIPYFTIDVTRFNGDPEPILQHCGLDTCVSFGLLTDDCIPNGEKDNVCRFFIRIKLTYGIGEDHSSWPDAHHIIHAQQGEITSEKPESVELNEKDYKTFTEIVKNPPNATCDLKKLMRIEGLHER